MLFAFFHWTDSLCLWQSSHGLLPNLASLLFSELPPTKKSPMFNDVYLNAAMITNPSWSGLYAKGSLLLHQGVLRSLLVSFPILWGIFTLSSSDLEILRSCFCSHFVLSVHLTFRRLTAPSSAPHFHNKVDSQQWQRKLGSFPAEIFVGQRAHFGNGCVQIFHVCLQIGWGWRGCPRPPPVPTGRPTPMFDFFLTTPRNRLWSRAAAPTLPAFSPAFARGGGGRGETAATHTHTHMGHSLLHLALFGTGLLYLPRNRLFLAQKIILPLEEK